MGCVVGFDGTGNVRHSVSYVRVSSETGTLFGVEALVELVDAVRVLFDI